MKIVHSFLFSLLTAFCLSCSTVHESSTMELPRKKNFHLFLLAGQSNMAGRGDLEAEDQQPLARVLVLSKDGTWKPAVDPLHFDKPTAGVGLGRTFARTLADLNQNVTIGLIPAACGGSPITTWEPGRYFDQTFSHPYDDAIRRAKLAMQQGTLKAILWHQGESDCTEALAPVYEAKLEQLITRFRTDLNAPDLPIFIGQLGQFLTGPQSGFASRVTDAHRAVAREMNQVAFVSSDGLTCKSDNIHFDSRSQREFGKRFAAAYLKTQTSPARKTAIR